MCAGLIAGIPDNCRFLGALPTYNPGWRETRQMLWLREPSHRCSLPLYRGGYPILWAVPAHACRLAAEMC